MMMSTGSMHVPVRDLFGGSAANVGYFHIEMEFDSGEGMVAIDGD